MKKPSRLLELNEWLTLSEAAKDLSRDWYEEVTEADILKFALDGHLKLSVEFANGIKAVPVITVNKKSPFLTANLGDVVMELRGVWDLYILGTGQCIIERLYRARKNVPPAGSGIRGFLGSFVTGRGGEIYQLVEPLNPSEYATRGLKKVPEFPYITESGAVDQAKIEAAIAQLNEMWKRFCQDNAAVTLDDPCFYDQLLQLPQDSTLVVRSEALKAFEDSFTEKEPQNEESTSTKTPTIERSNDYNECIVQVIKEFTDINGYAPTTVEEVLSRMKNKPPLGFTTNFQKESVSINGSSGVITESGVQPSLKRGGVLC